MKKTPLKRKTPLSAKTPLKAKTPFKSMSTLKRTPFKRKPIVKSESTMKNPKSKTESLPALIKELDGVFSRYIHLRDALPNGRFICISCGKNKPISDAQAGHYYPRGTMSTRFDEDNVHLECIYDNCFNKDHLKGYFDNLLMKIGQDRLWQLDQKAKQMKKWTHYELKELIEYYKNEVKKLKNND